MARVLPSGRVTFLFTDIEGSTRLLDQLGPQAYAIALANHRLLLREEFAEHRGVEVDTQGDAFFVAFGDPDDAIACARRVTDELADGPVRVRIGVHTGHPLVTDDGYVGPDVHRAARIAAAGHGGQVLVSKETHDLVDAELTDLGEHRLKDFATPVWIFQLGSVDFPPLTTISNTNLPNLASDFVGRETEMGELVALMRNRIRMVTLTGPAGSGKTRLAIEAAARLVPECKAGTFWIDLAPVRDPALVRDAIAQVIGARNGLAEHIAERQMLLVIDNFEHVVAAAPDISRLVERCPNLRIMVTSRERLRVSAESEFSVDALSESDAVELFVSRAGVKPEPAIVELCRALDNLPLAVELAAARASILSPQQILDRLAGRLDLLKAGRDADPRQRTLRAAIEWSVDLLSADEKRLFARMSVFVGGCDLTAAEVVADADLDILQSLVDKNLVRHADERFWMLESIRTYASEQLAASPESAAAVRERHARYYTDFCSAQDAILEAGEPEEGPVAALDPEINNLRAAVDWALAANEPDIVRAITAALPMYWTMRGYYAEGRVWLDRAIALVDTRDNLRRRLLSALGQIAYALGDHVVAVEAADEAAVLAAELGGATQHMTLLREQALAALNRSDYETAEKVFRERLDVAIAVGNGVATSSCRINLAAIANKTGRHELAEELLTENLDFVRSRGQTRCEATTLAGLSEARLSLGTDDAAESALGARLATAIRDSPLALDCLELFAATAAGGGDAALAATVLAATEAVRDEGGFGLDADEARIRAVALDRLGPLQDAVADSWEAGRALDLNHTVELASARAPGISRARPG